MFGREIDAQFRAADENGDGFLSREEAERHFRFVAREFDRVDSDGDGRISLEEFRRLRRLQLERRLRKGA
jgi:Ca2+-binding EF-hand superfamily protein